MSSKIKISVVTEMQFNCVSDLFKYLDSDTQAQITGFRNEVYQAYKTGQKLEVKTARPSVGAVTKSYIEVIEEVVK